LLDERDYGVILLSPPLRYSRYGDVVAALMLIVSLRRRLFVRVVAKTIIFMLRALLFADERRARADMPLVYVFFLARRPLSELCCSRCYAVFAVYGCLSSRHELDGCFAYELFYALLRYVDSAALAATPERQRYCRYA